MEKNLFLRINSAQTSQKVVEAVDEILSQSPIKFAKVLNISLYTVRFKQKDEFEKLVNNHIKELKEQLKKAQDDACNICF